MVRDCLSAPARRGGRLVANGRPAHTRRTLREQLAAATRISGDPNHCEAYSPFAFSYHLTAHPNTRSNSSRTPHRIWEADAQTHPGPVLDQVCVRSQERGPTFTDSALLENPIRSAPGIGRIELAVAVFVGSAVRVRLSLDGFHHERRAAGRATSNRYRNGHAKTVAPLGSAARIDDQLKAGGRQRIGQALLSRVRLDDPVVRRDAVWVATRTSITQELLPVHPGRGYVDAAFFRVQPTNRAADGAAGYLGIRQGATAPESSLPTTWLATDADFPQSAAWIRADGRPPRGPSGVSLPTCPLARLGRSSAFASWSRSGRRSEDLPRCTRPRPPQLRPA